MSWSKLLETNLAKQAKQMYDSDSSRRYHNWDHVKRLYWHAENTFNLEYDLDLDKAVLAHDVIYDKEPNKELRSVNWITEQTGNEEILASVHIFRTINHEPSIFDNRMVLLDLADFMFPGVAEENYKKIMLESIELYSITPQEFIFNSNKILNDLYFRIISGLAQDKIPETDLFHFEKILNGINDIIKKSKKEI